MVLIVFTDELFEERKYHIDIQLGGWTSSKFKSYAPVLKIISLNKNVLIIVFFVCCSLQEETAADEIKTEN